MSKFYIYFNGYTEIEAEDMETALAKFDNMNFWGDEMNLKEIVEEEGDEDV